MYHYDSVPKSIPTELLENGREATWYHAEIDGKDVLYYLCPIVSSVYKNQGYLFGHARGRVVPRVRNAAAEWCGPIPTG